MTQQTINLYDGLEALYYFDEDYFDGTANDRPDSSASAWGASGTNRALINDSDIKIEHKNEDTLGREYMGSNVIVNFDNGTAITLGDVNDSEFDAKDQEWSLETLKYDSNNLVWKLNEQIQEKTSVSGSPAVRNSTQPLTIGSRSIDDRWAGEISFVGLWSRALSDAERDYLNRLTAPRRSQL